MIVDSTFVALPLKKKLVVFNMNNFIVKDKHEARMHN